MADRAAPSDGELWRQAAAGDGDSFGVLFDRHADAVHRYCARRTGSLDAADDLLSIVFLEAWRRRAEVQLVDDVALPWLYGVAQRTVQRRWRTALRHRRALHRLPTVLMTPDHADEVAARLDDEKQLAQLQQAFRRLRPAEQDVLTLCVWQGLDYASAAIALGVPVGTVRSRLSRARARLQANIPPPGRQSSLDGGPAAEPTVALRSSPLASPPTDTAWEQS
ncbi:sigma-70 family RNA polymerase sigma factor [Kineococcus sp. R8]|uniref:RNA polymerase sigma factor n=1 Tax=Kineococcus siccus TaxID=2696567 RepID=UPI001411CD69|nr:RNA polymerase sigma factor [Kineococcus siccus]NAZ84393.1 sigma-70 family RNA polymerase sigma factor [Kineococcus siccus]